MRRLYIVFVGLIVLIAFAGAGFASGHYLITNIRQIKPSVIKQLDVRLQGLNGANGTNGANGIDGPPGANGSPGHNGTPGATGSRGPQGPPGPTGPQGPQGTVATTTFVQASAAIPMDINGDAYATCPIGDVLLGGGFNVGDNLEVIVSEPMSNSWHLRVKNNTGETANITAWAACGK